MTYTGAFVRQWLGQTAAMQSQGMTSCPDILFSGQTDTGPGQYATAAAYATTTQANVAFSTPPTIPNFMYLRAYQAGTTAGSNVFMYVAQGSMALWPQNWLATNISVGSNTSPQNWAWAPATAGNPILVTEQALIWKPAPLNTQVDHYCVISWADNSGQDNPVPPNFQQLGYLQSFDNLMYFLATHGNMGWRNTNDNLVPPPNMEYTTTIQTKDNPESINITVYFNNCTDANGNPQGTFQVTLSGDVTYSSGPTPLAVANYQGGYQVPALPFAANATATLIVTYYAQTLPLNQYASITADINHPVAGEALEQMRDLARVPGTIMPIKMMALGEGSRLTVQPVFVVGSQHWNMQWATQPTTED